MPAQRIAFRAAVTATAVTLLAAGCSTMERFNEEQGRVGAATELSGTPTATATVRLAPAAGSPVEGRVKFTQFGAIVIVRANFIGLLPNREYGLHIHEKGDCTGGAGTGPGGHFNPGATAHGQPGKVPHHAGDLPNVLSNGEGSVVYEFDTGEISLTEGPGNVIGRSIIISRDRDDYRTQPDGNSGPPLACGFIRTDGGAFGVPIK
jgi:superoxide dismutase, Cu-Zn family